MARFSPVSQAALLLLAAAAAAAIQSNGERRPAAVPPHYFDRATPPLTVRHRPPRPTPPPYAVPMEPLVPYSQPDPLYHRPEPAAELQTLRKSGGVGDVEAAATAVDDPPPGPGPAPDALFPDSDAQPQHLPPLAAYGPPYPEQLYYVREPEPIIEIIIKESNESLPAPPTTPPPPPKKEPVHVFYVKYKKDPTKYGKDSVVYESPVPAITPATTDTITESHSYGPPPAPAVTAAPPPTTTLRTIIRPDSETYHGSGLRVTFGGPHEDDSEVPSESAQRPSLALPQAPFQASPPFPGHFVSGHGPHKREHAFFPPQPSPSRPGPTAAGPGGFPPSSFQQPQGSFAGPHRPFSAPPTPFLRQLPGQAQPFAPPPPQRPPPQPFHGPPQPPKLRPQPQFGLQPQFQRPLHPQPPAFRPGSTAAFPPPPPPPPPPHGRNPQNQQYIEQQRKVIQQQQAELFQQQQQQQHQGPQQQHQGPPPPQSHILQQLQQQRHQQQLAHQQQLQQQHIQQQRLQHPQRLPPPQPQPPQQPPSQQHQTAQQLGFNGEIVKSVPSLEEHLTTHEVSKPRPVQQFLGPATSASHAHGLGQPAPATSPSLGHGLGQPAASFSPNTQPEPRNPTTFTVQQSISQPQQQIQQHQHFQQSQQQFQQQHQQQQQQLLQHQQLPSVSQPQQTPPSRPFTAPQSIRRPPLLPAAPPTSNPPKVFSLVPSSTAAPSTTTATPTTAAADKDKKDKPLPALPDEVPEDLRQQLLSSGILSNADIQVLDYDKVGDIPIESLPPEALENFYGAGSAPVPAVVSPNATAPPKTKAPAPAPSPSAAAPVEMKVVRYDSASAAGQQLAEQYVRADATQVDPVVLNDAGYNRYLPLKVSGVGFPLPDVPELRGRNVTSVVILAPVDYDLLQQGEAAAPDADADAEADLPTGDEADRAGRAAAIQVKGVRFVTGDILKDLVKNPSNENYRRWLERERKATAEQQAIILLVAEGTATVGKEIFMYDAGSQRVSKLSGKLSAAFVDVAEANANSQDIDNISAASPHIMELRHRGSLDVSAEGSEAAESRHPAPVVVAPASTPAAISISGGYSKTSASS